MPWSAQAMKAKGAQNPAKAEAMANAIRRSCLASGKSESECDRIAIATALARTNKGVSK